MLPHAALRQADVAWQGVKAQVGAPGIGQPELVARFGGVEQHLVDVVANCTQQITGIAQRRLVHRFVARFRPQHLGRLHGPLAHDALAVVVAQQVEVEVVLLGATAAGGVVEDHVGGTDGGKDGLRQPMVLHRGE